MKCDQCLNSRLIISENGIHYICTLSSKKSYDCLFDKIDYSEIVAGKGYSESKALECLEAHDVRRTYSLKELEGKHILSGIEQCVGDYINGGYVKFTLDGITYKAVEDPEDGYRSCMNDLEIVTHSCKFPLPDIEVICHYSKGDHGNDDILEFIDVNNRKTFLRIGTENYNDYYPYCVMEYIPANLSCNERMD